MICENPSKVLAKIGGMFDTFAINWICMKTKLSHKYFVGRQRVVELIRMMMWACEC